MKISREYKLVAKTTDGKIISVNQGRKGIQLYEMEAGQVGDMSTCKKNEYTDLSEIESVYKLQFGFTKYNGSVIDFDFLDSYLFQENTIYGSGKKNREKESELK